MAIALDADSIREILSERSFDRFKGAIESDILECKSTPYRLDEVSQKQELAKDVSGMANAGGGFIVIGLKTEANPTRAEEQIVDLRPFEEMLLNTQQYEDVLKRWTHPSLDGVRVEWIPTQSDSSKGIGVITVDAQRLERRPVLVTRTIDESGKSVEIVFGFFERRRTSVDHTSVARLHSLLQAGLQSEETRARLDTMQHLLEELIFRSKSGTTKPSNPVTERDLLARISKAFEAADLSNRPSYALAARPTEATDIPGLFRSSREPVVQWLETPPQLRENGFHLNADGQARMVDANRRRVLVHEGGLLELWRDGTLLCVARGDEQYLCWPPPTGGPRSQFLAINAIALIESAYLFLVLARKIYETSVPQPEHVEFTVVLSNMTRQTPSRMKVPSHGSLVVVGNEAPDSHNLFAVTANLKNEPPEKIAFNIAAKIFEWYGLEHDRVPFQVKPDVIDIEKLAAT